ncbi:hypothetical protein A0H81_08427 [Grifola frondosa]|uniref:Uncharacterized protein n=1 Tax=Grifola frondosa TaxID=5627 RepID=A0A1C7M3W2_GRIFR|nr:hypothetical protein A0H81_08427 [Grifola frondosa]
MSLRQRIPFRYFDAEEETERVLDEQEQEELIQDLRRQSDSSNNLYVTLLHVLLALSGIVHLIYLYSPTKESPFSALLGSHSPAPPIPLASAFDVLHMLLHLHLHLHLLHPEHPIRRMLSSAPNIPFPLPLTHPLILTAPALAPVLSLLLRRDWRDALWWSVASGMTWLVYSTLKWIQKNEEDIHELEKMQYDARGA